MTKQCETCQSLLAVCKTVLLNIGDVDRFSRQMPHELEFFARVASNTLASAIASAEFQDGEDVEDRDGQS